MTDLVEFQERERRIATRLGRVQQICRTLAGCVVACSFLIWFLVAGEKVQAIPGMPSSLPLSLTVLAMVLILLGSRLRSTILRRAFPVHAAVRADPETVIAAYQKAALLSFVLLQAAAVLGLVVALLSGSAFYGHILCAAALIGMLTRWPRAVEVDRLLRGKLRL